MQFWIEELSTYGPCISRTGGKVVLISGSNLHIASLKINTFVALVKHPFALNFASAFFTSNSKILNAIDKKGDVYRYETSTWHLISIRRFLPGGNGLTCCDISHEDEVAFAQGKSISIFSLTNQTKRINIYSRLQRVFALAFDKQNDFLIVSGSESVTIEHNVLNQIGA